MEDVKKIKNDDDSIPIKQHGKSGFHPDFSLKMGLGKVELNLKKLKSHARSRRPLDPGLLIMDDSSKIVLDYDGKIESNLEIINKLKKNLTKMMTQNINNLEKNFEFQIDHLRKYIVYFN